MGKTEGRPAGWAIRAGPSGRGGGSLLAALQQLLEQRVGPAAQGGRGVQLYDPACLQHQHPVRVQDRVEPVWEKVVSRGTEDNALKKADLLSPVLSWAAWICPQLCRAGAALALC